MAWVAPPPPAWACGGRVIEYLLAENSVLKEQLRGRRVRYTDAQRRRLALAAKKLGRKALRGLDTLVTPDTLLRWYRRLVARKFCSSIATSSWTATRCIRTRCARCSRRVVSKV